jgi:threonine synthase
VGYLGLKEYMKSSGPVTGVFLETAHPGKFREVVEDTLGTTVTLPDTLQAFLTSNKLSVPMSSRFEDFKNYLVERSNE